MPRPLPLELGFQDQGRFERGDLTGIQQGRDLGARSVREILWRDQIPRTAGGGYNFGAIDAIVNQARATGVAPQLVLSNRRGSGMGDPEKYAQFVKLAAQHFRGRVNRYSLENEPDLRMAPEKYRRLFEEGSHALQQVSPHAQILFGELSPHDPIGYTKRVLAKGGLQASGFALHPYQNTDPLAPGTNPYWGQGQIGNLRRVARQLATLDLKTKSGHTPGMYLTEFGYGRYGNEWVPEDQAARMWPRAIEQARQAGAKQIIAYHLTGNPNPQAKWDTGLLNADGTARPAYFSLQHAVAAGMLREAIKRKRR